MRNYLTILALCLVAVSCKVNEQQVLSTPAVLPNLEQANEIVSKSSSAENSIKEITKSVKTPEENIKTSKPLVSTSTHQIQPVSLVYMKIITPEGESNFSVELKEGQNACDNLKTAKNEDKIKSLTIKDTYLESLGSLYVYEINSYKNNWILSLNGKSSSVGCSQVFPKNGDFIEWKFN